MNYPDGRFAVQFNGATLGFKVFDKIQTVQPGAIVDNKRLSAVLEQVKAQQAAYPARQQRGHGARQRPPNNLEAPGLPSKGRAPRHGATAAPADRPQAGHHRAVARVGFSGIGRSTPMLAEDGGSATAEWREPTSSDRLPVHRSESPTGYSSAGCSPAEPASASPVTDNSSSIPIQRGNQMRCSTPLRRCSPSRAARARRQRECHLYFARRVTFLSCADILIVRPTHWLSSDGDSPKNAGKRLRASKSPTWCNGRSARVLAACRELSHCEMGRAARLSGALRGFRPKALTALRKQLGLSQAEFALRGVAPHPTLPRRRSLAGEGMGGVWASRSPV